MRTKISEYSTTNSDNTDIEGINVAEGCPPSSINNAIREVMVHLKEFQTGASGDPLTVAGTFVASGSASLNGTTIPSSATLVKTTDKISVLAATSSSELAGVISDETGTGALVFANTPTLVTPTLGAASATSVAFGAGAVGTPSITATGDLNTGIYFPAADTIAFTEGGVEAMRIDSNGDVGIGTSSPVGSLTILRLSAASSLSLRHAASGNGYGYLLSTTGTTTNDLIISSEFNGNPTERMRIDSSGNVGIGTSSPATRLTVSGGDTSLRGQVSVVGVSDDARITLYRDSTFNSFFSAGSADAKIGTAANLPLTFWANSSERARITSGGDFIVVVIKVCLVSAPKIKG